MELVRWCSYGYSNHPGCYCRWPVAKFRERDRKYRSVFFLNVLAKGRTDWPCRFGGYNSGWSCESICYRIGFYPIPLSFPHRLSGYGWSIPTQFGTFSANKNNLYWLLVLSLPAPWNIVICLNYIFFWLVNGFTFTFNTSDIFHFHSLVYI